MKSKRILKYILGTAGTLLLLLVLTILFWLGPTVKLIVQAVGPKALGTDVTMQKLTLNPIKGIIQLSDFSIRNPDRFGRSNAVSLASLDISVDMASLFSSTVIVQQVEINSPHFVYEQDLQRDNITEFIRSIQSFAGIDPEAPPKPEKTAKSKKHGTPKVVIVEQLAVNDAQFNLANTQDQALDVSIGFETLTVSMTNGTAQLNNVYVRNPGRLQTPNLFTLDRVQIEMEPASIYSTNIQCRSVEILNPHAFIEHNPETDSLGEFLKIASSLASKIPPPPSEPKTAASAAPAEPADAEPVPATKMTLDRVTIDNIQVHAVDTGDPELSIHLTLDQLTAALKNGRLMLNGLRLSNPGRLETPDLFSLKNLSVKFTPQPHNSPAPVIEDMQINQPYAFLELNDSRNTVSEFLKIVNSYTDRLPGYPIPELPPAPEQPETNETPNAAPAAPPLVLHNLQVNDLGLYLKDNTATNTAGPAPALIAGIDQISIKLSEGRLGLHSIRIPNAAGFSAADIFHLAEVLIELDPETVFSDPVVIDRIFINSPSLNLEQTETSGNAAELQTTLRKFSPPKQLQAPSASAASPAAPPPAALAEQPVLLHQLIVTNLNVSMKLPADTNTTDNALIGKINPIDQMSKLNPMSQISKLNPLASDAAAEEEAEADPDAPITLAAFRNLALEPLKGSLRIDGLRISNPHGFSRRDMLKIEQLQTDLDFDSLQSDTLQIKDISITKPRIRYERQILKDNLTAFKEAVEQATTQRRAAMDQGTAAAEAEAGPKEEKKEDGQKVIIDRIAISGCIVYAKLSALPTIPIPLPLPELKDIGKEKGGATPAEAATQVYDTLYEEMVSAVSGATGFAGDALKGIGGLTSDMLTRPGAADKNTDASTESTAEKTRSRYSKSRRAGGKPSATH